MIASQTGFSLGSTAWLPFSRTIGEYQPLLYGDRELIFPAMSGLAFVESIQEIRLRAVVSAPYLWAITARMHLATVYGQRHKPRRQVE